MDFRRCLKVFRYRHYFYCFCWTNHNRHHLRCQDDTVSGLQGVKEQEKKERSGCCCFYYWDAQSDKSLNALPLDRRMALNFSHCWHFSYLNEPLFASLVSGCFFQSETSTSVDVKVPSSILSQWSMNPSLPQENREVWGFLRLEKTTIELFHLSNCFPLLFHFLSLNFLHLSFKDIQFDWILMSNVTSFHSAIIIKV
jgi:hypothetical protein